MPATFAARLELATALRDDHARRFAALRAAPPAKQRSAVVEATEVAGVLRLTVVRGDAAETPVADLLAAWKGPVELTRIPDVFNDKLDYGADTWSKLEALNDGMLPVMEKYEMLQQDSPKVAAATAAFVANYQVVGTALAAMEARAAGDARSGAALEAECAELTARVAAMAAAHGVVIRVGAPAAAARRAAGGAVPAPLAALGVMPVHVAFLADALRASGVAAPAFELLYQASVDGVTRADVMRCCKDKGPALVIGREASGGWLFGGYMDCGISDEGGKRTVMGGFYVAAPHAFVFTLTNPHGMSPTVWCRGKDERGVLRTKIDHRLVRWFATLGSKATSMLEWDAADDGGCFEPRAPHGDKAFTGTKEWTCSDVVVYRV